jgi:hypothetical protein
MLAALNKNYSNFQFFEKVCIETFFAIGWRISKSNKKFANGRSNLKLIIFGEPVIYCVKSYAL